jgi:hypothetical protein
VRNIVERRRATNVFGENMLAVANKESADASHQHFAQALNSPADSLFSDYQVRSSLFTLNTKRFLEIF